MQRIRAFFTKPVRIRVLWALLAVLLCSVLTAYLVLILQPREAYLIRFLARQSHYLMPLLNFLPPLLLMMLLFFVTGSVAGPCLGVGGVLVLLSYVNRIKLQMRGDPLLHWDFLLFGELMGIADGLGGNLLVGVAALLVLYAFAAVLIGKRIKVRRMPGKARIACAAGCALVIAVLNGTVYSSKAVYDSLPVWGSFYNLADIHTSRGSLYCFLYNFNAHRVKEPDQYDPQAVRDAANNFSLPAVDTEDALRPHVIIVMGEALSALSQSEALSFDGYRDPLETFQALGDSFVSGSLVVPSRGGGTADTEFDVLTGRASRYLRTAPYAYRLLSGPTEALPSLLAKAGYSSLALHPGYPWFYNRQNVYRYLGFDTMAFEDAFPREAYLDTYISEEATYDMLLSMLSAHIGQTDHSPLFAFCLTIQNHAAYLNRYLPEGTVNFSSSVPLTADESNILSNYFHGVIDADVQLGRLADYLEALVEPAVLVCFGDHLPSMSWTLYDKLIPGEDAEEGSFLEAARLYTVPFMIWMNTAARESTDIAARAVAAAMPSDGTISSNYLGGYLLELLGYDALSPFFLLGNELRASFPVLLETRQFRPGGVAEDAPDGDEAAMLKLYRDWAYYNTTGT